MYKLLPAILVFLSVFLGLIALLSAIKNGSDELAVFLITLSAWFAALSKFYSLKLGNDSNLLIVFYVQIMPDDFVMQLHRF